MITVASAASEIIKESPFMEEALAQNLLNISSLARFIQKKVQEKVKKPVKTGAIVMALKRLQAKIYFHPAHTHLLKNLGDLTVRSHLFEITYANSDTMKAKLKDLFIKSSLQPNIFCTLSQGVFETTVIAGKQLEDDILEIFQGEKMISTFDNLSSISMKLPQETVSIPGVYYAVMKLLAWEGVNVVEVVSTYTEFTLVFKDEQIDKAFSLLKQSLKNTV